jgi:hypothetical protein
LEKKRQARCSGASDGGGVGSLRHHKFGNVGMVPPDCEACRPRLDAASAGSRIALKIAPLPSSHQATERALRLR